MNKDRKKMSSEDSTTKEKNCESSGAQENHGSEPASQPAVFITNGHKEVTDISDPSTAHLLKTIVIASQAASPQQRLISPADTSGKMEDQENDLNSYKREQYVQILSATQNGLQQQTQHDQKQGAQFVLQSFPEVNTSSLSKNGVDSRINDLLKSPTSKKVCEALLVNTDQSTVQVGSNFKVTTSMPAFESFNRSHPKQSPDCNVERTHVLQRLLSGESMTERNFHVSVPSSNFPLSSPDFSKSSPTSSANSSFGDSNLSLFTETSQSANFMDTEPQTASCTDIPRSVNMSDTTTQSSLITNTGNLRLDSMVENNLDSEMKYDMACEWNVTKLDEDLDRSKCGKVPRLVQDSDASSALSPSVDNVFQVEGAQQEVPSDFTFQLFGQGESDQGGIGVFSNMISENEVSSSQDTPTVPAVVEQTFKRPQTAPSSVVKQQRERLRRSKEPILSQAFPAKFHGYELRILQQPEEQHRARYLTEGSRGSVKNRSGNGFPQVKLFGYTGEATLQIFIGNDSGRVRPHGFYQACKVCGKNSTMCTEKDIDGTTVIEIELQAANDMTASIDCVGILKLRNADVEQRIGITKAKKKSTKARMIFRVTFQKPDGNPQVLQVASSTILCTQPIGQPEICKMSLKECTVTGGEELYIIGKNFLRGTQVLFQQISEDDCDKILWEKEADIDKDYFQTTHMIVTVPEYEGKPFMESSVECQVIVNSGGKLSDPQPFFYKAVDPTTVVIKQDTMETVEESRKRNYPFVAPEALELNQQIQQVQQVSSKSDMFQLPPGIITGMAESSRYTPMEEDSRAESPASQVVIEEKHAEVLGKNESQILKQKSYEQENMDTPQSWESDQNSNLNSDSEKHDLQADLNSLNFPSMSSEDFNDQSFDNSFGNLKSHHLSNESFPSEHIGMSNTSQSDASIVSQFLQNMSMALKQSDPMFSGKETILSKQMMSQSSTVPTTINNHLVMSAATQESQHSINTTEKSQTLEHSFLKEALTCPTASLANIHSLTSQCQPAALFIPKSENVCADMDMQIDNSLNGVNTTLEQKTEEVMDYNTVTSVNFNTQVTSIGYETSQSYKLSDMSQYNFTSSAPAYTFDNVAQSQQSRIQFSLADILTSLEARSTDRKPVMNIASGGMFSNPTLSKAQRVAERSNTFTHDSPSHQKTIMSTREQSHGNSQSPLPGSVERSLHHTTSQHGSLELKSPSQLQNDTITSVLQQMLSQNGESKQKPEPFAVSPQQQYQQQAECVNEYQQQNEHVNEQQFQQTTEHANEQQQYQQQQNEQVNGQQQLYHQQHLQQQNYQQPGQSQTFAQTQQHYNQTQDQQQQQLFQLLNQQTSKQQTQSVLMSPPSNSQPAVSVIQPETCNSPSVASIPNQNPVAPQIIICNNPGPQGQFPQTQFGSPSIVIVPGQAGPNNQVENLLRSILGSMMQPPQQQQQL